MTIFCTQCGSKNLDHARFCEACGKPMKASAVDVTPSNAALPIAKPKRNRIIAFALIGVSALMLFGGVAYWLTPESPTEASFTRAINRYFESNPSIVEKQICRSDLSYQKNEIRTSDRYTVKWMNALVQSGLYSDPAVESSGSYFAQNVYVYSVTDKGKEAVKNGKLCFGEGLSAKVVRGYDTIRANNSAMAQANLTLRDEAAWLAKSPAREYILENVRLDNIPFAMPIRLIDGTWQIDARSGQDIEDLLGQRAPVAHATSSSNFFATIKQWFSFNSNPLIGKWQDTTGFFTFEFTSDHLIVGPVTQSAKYEINGDIVTVTTEDRPINIKVIDKDTISMDIGIGDIRMKRLNP